MYGPQNAIHHKWANSVMVNAAVSCIWPHLGTGEGERGMKPLYLYRSVKDSSFLITIQGIFIKVAGECDIQSQLGGDLGTTPAKHCVPRFYNAQSHALFVYVLKVLKSQG